MEALARSSSVLLVCRDERARSALAEGLRAKGHAVTIATSVAAADDALERGIDLTIVDGEHSHTRDGGCSGGEALALLENLQRQPEGPLLLLLPRPHAAQAASAMRLGATQVLVAPFDSEVVLLSVARALAADRQRRVARVARGCCLATLTDLVGGSTQMQQLRALVERVAGSPAMAVLLSGEPGSGKRLCARVLHQLSPRRDGPFAAASCAIADQHELQRQLFGCQRDQPGCSTPLERGVLELAHGGSAFVEHVEALGAPLQRQLLQLVEEKTVRRVGAARNVRSDIRLIASTAVDLRKAVEDGCFRRDLFSRLSIAPITLPPLRARRGDISALAAHRLKRLRAKLGGGPSKIAPAAIQQLEAHTWPGNLRELHNVVDRAALVAGERDLIEAKHIELPGTSTGNGDLASRPDYMLPQDGVELSHVERSLVMQALTRTRGNLTRAGRLLGLNRDQMRYRVEKFGMSDQLAKLRGGRRSARN